MKWRFCDTSSPSLVKGNKTSTKQHRLPGARCFHDMVTLPNTNIAVMFGGKGRSTIFSDVFFLHLDTVNWSRPMTTGTPPSSRMYHTMFVEMEDSDNDSDTSLSYIYVFGGVDRSGHQLNDLWRLNMESFMWEQIEIRNLNEFPNIASGISGHSLAVSQSRSKTQVLIFGGENGDNNKINQTYRLSILRNSMEDFSDQNDSDQDEEDSDNDDNDDEVYAKIEIIEHGSSFSSNSCPAPRSHHSSAITLNKLWIFGGELEGGTTDDSLWCFDIEKLYWKQYSAEDTFPKSRCHHTLTSYVNNSYLCLFGGMHRNATKENQLLNDVWIFDIETCCWREYYPRGDIPSPRYGHTCIDFQNRLLIFGGSASVPSSTTTSSSLKTSEVLANDLWRLEASTGELVDKNQSQSFQQKKVDRVEAAEQRVENIADNFAMKMDCLTENIANQIHESQKQQKQILQIQKAQNEDHMKSLSKDFQASNKTQLSAIFARIESMENEIQRMQSERDQYQELFENQLQKQQEQMETVVDRMKTDLLSSFNENLNSALNNMRENIIHEIREDINGINDQISPILNKLKEQDQYQREMNNQIGNGLQTNHNQIERIIELIQSVVDEKMDQQYNQLCNVIQHHSQEILESILSSQNMARLPNQVSGKEEQQEQQKEWKKTKIKVNDQDKNDLKQSQELSNFDVEQDAGDDVIGNDEEQETDSHEYCSEEKSISTHTIDKNIEESKDANDKETKYNENDDNESLDKESSGLNQESEPIRMMENETQFSDEQNLENNKDNNNNNNEKDNDINKFNNENNSNNVCTEDNDDNINEEDKNKFKNDVNNPQVDNNNTSNNNNNNDNNNLDYDQNEEIPVETNAEDKTADDSNSSEERKWSPTQDPDAMISQIDDSMHQNMMSHSNYKEEEEEEEEEEAILDMDDEYDEDEFVDAPEETNEERESFQEKTFHLDDQENPFSLIDNNNDISNNNNNHDNNNNNNREKNKLSDKENTDKKEEEEEEEENPENDIDQDFSQVMTLSHPLSKFEDYF